MKIWMLIVGMVFCFGGKLMAHESACQWNPSLVLMYQCSDGILKLENKKAYLRPEKLFAQQGQFFLLDNASQWTALEQVSWDESGWYVDMDEPRCPNGHIGIYRVKKTWYCFEESCPYFIGNNDLYR